MYYRVALLAILLLPSLAAANPPVASYIFPAGAQRGTKVNVRVGGLFLHDKCGFEMLGVGIDAPTHLTRTKTTWFEGPILPLPDSQRQEDYPKDMAGSLAIAADAPLGVRYWRLWTSQGATPALKFVVGDLPEVIENEIDGDPVPVVVTLPMTINGRIFPRENIDIWSFQAKKGETIRCEVNAHRLGSPLDARLELRDPQDRRVTEVDAPVGGDPVLTFTAAMAGEYQIRIQDTQSQGGQAYVYRLTLTAEPHVDRVYPLGGRRGSTFDVIPSGQGIPAMFTVTLPMDARADFPYSFSARAKQTNAIVLDTDIFPEFIAPNDLAKTISLPAVLNGRIDKPGAIDTWNWQGKKGSAWEFDLRAARLGSKLDGVVTITDQGGKVLAKAEATAADPLVRFTVPADGEYGVRVQDRFRSRGGPDFAYRLRIAPPPVADFRLVLATDAVTLPRKGTAKLQLIAERVGGFKEPIAIEVQGLPAHVNFPRIFFAENENSIEITFKAADAAKIDVARLSIIGKANNLVRTAQVKVGRGLPELSSVLLAIAVPTPFVIKGEYDMGFGARGATHKRKYKIVRNGFDGPIEISLADRQIRHLQGVEASAITVPAGVTEFTYSAYLPPWMETGRTCRVCVMGVGVHKEPDGTLHRISFSSVDQNEQLVTVVGPGMLALEAERTSFTAEPGKTIRVPVQIRRGQDVAGPVELTLVLPVHLHGLAAAKTTIAAKSDRGELVIECADKLAGPFNIPLTLRATLMRNGEPLIAEVKLDVKR
jgi:hypothetical protein